MPILPVYAGNLHLFLPGNHVHWTRGLSLVHCGCPSYIGNCYHKQGQSWTILGSPSNHFLYTDDIPRMSRQLCPSIPRPSWTIHGCPSITYPYVCVSPYTKDTKTILDNPRTLSTTRLLLLFIICFNFILYRIRTFIAAAW